MTWIFFAIISAVVSGIIAKHKRREVWAWVIFGLLFGVIGLIIIALLPKIEEMKKCPRCSNELLITTMTCHHCYYDYKEAANKYYKEKETTNNHIKD